MTKEIDRIVFTSLEKTNYGAFGTPKYFVLNDQNYVEDFYAESDEAAKEIFRGKYGK